MKAAEIIYPIIISAVWDYTRLHELLLTSFSRRIGLFNNRVVAFPDSATANLNVRGIPIASAEAWSAANKPVGTFYGPICSAKLKSVHKDKVKFLGIEVTAMHNAVAIFWLFFRIFNILRHFLVSIV
jgi:hypothetical protein